MKIQFLGTGAGEGYPGYWCRCPHCSYARAHGGKNLRTNSCALIDGRLLIDIGPACMDNAARFGIDLTGIGTLLITHPHEDHLYPQNLFWRDTNEEYLSLPYPDMVAHGGPRFTPLPELNVYGNSYTVALLGSAFEQHPAHRMKLHTIREGESFSADGYTVTPVRGNHGPSGFAHSYILRSGGRTLLYALDTGTYDADQLELIGSFRFDAVVMEGTAGLNVQYGGHMCLENNIKTRALFIELGCIEAGTPFVLTHMSPHWCPPHDWYESIVAAEGMTLAYDGMELEI